MFLKVRVEIAFFVHLVIPISNDRVESAVTCESFSAFTKGHL